MISYSRSDDSNDALSHRLAASAAHDCASTASLLADIGEFDARRLYVPAAYPSMHAYCVHELHLSDDAALKRIRAARIGRTVPAIFPAVAEGRLHLTAVALLAPHLTPENADELLAAATHKTNAEIKQLIATRFPQPALPTRLQAFSPTISSSEQVVSEPPGIEAERLVLEPSEAVVPRSKVMPLSAQWVGIQVTLSQSTYAKLRRAQALLSHQIPSGDVAEVLDRTLDLAIRQLEKQKFAATENPRPTRRATKSARHIPAHVKRAVWERDEGRCTFVSDDGRRCGETHRLEFDHVDPVALGGRATVDGIRLRCRAHNQYDAERMFGTEFMRHKREQAREAADAHAVAEARAPAEAHAQEAIRKAAADAAAQAAAERAKEQDVVPWLRQLGYRATEAREAAKLCENIPDAPLEQRVRVALSFFHPRTHSRSHATNGVGTAA